MNLADLLADVPAISVEENKHLPLLHRLLAGECTFEEAINTAWLEQALMFGEYTSLERDICILLDNLPSVPLPARLNW